jgi:hypothetical protein
MWVARAVIIAYADKRGRLLSKPAPYLGGNTVPLSTTRSSNSIFSLSGMIDSISRKSSLAAVAKSAENSAKRPSAPVNGPLPTPRSVKNSGS